MSWLQNGEIQNQLDAAKHEKEAVELKMMAQSMNSVMENTKWELESALSQKNVELEEMQKKSDTLQANSKKLECELNQLRASSQLDLESCKSASNDIIAHKDAQIRDLQMKIDKLQQLEKQVGEQ